MRVRALSPPDPILRRSHAATLLARRMLRQVAAASNHRYASPTPIRTHAKLSAGTHGKGGKTGAPHRRQRLRAWTTPPCVRGPSQKLDGESTDWRPSRGQNHQTVGRMDAPGWGGRTRRQRQVWRRGARGRDEGSASGGAGRKGAACACCLRAASWLPLLVCCGALGAQRCCRRVTARPPSSSRPSSIGGMQTLHAAARQANACCTC